MYKKIFEFVTQPLVRLLNRPNRINANILKRVRCIRSIKTKYGAFNLSVGNDILWFRANTFFSKEPDTLSWIDSFEPNEILYDIGANIGLYSIYTALKGNSVIAFEPESQNYSLLNHNIYLNKLSKKISSYNVALSDCTQTGKLNLSEWMGGSALHNFGGHLDYNKKPFDPSYQQSTLSFTLDEIIEKFKMPNPHHIKIDVDGLEKNVFNGSINTIRSKKTQSILIELNTRLKDDLDIIRILETEGYHLVSKFQPEFVKNTNFSHIFNYIFSRDKQRKISTSALPKDNQK